MSTMKMTVDELIAAPFSSRSQKDQERIVSDGRPTPHWCSRSRELDNSRQSLFDEIKWLTVSATTRRFYCWPCLLFKPPGLWNKMDVSDVALLTKSKLEHEHTPEHIEALFHLQTFINKNLKTTGVQTAVRNPEALKRLVDVVCSLAAVQQPPYVPKNTSSILEVKDCVRAMVLLRKYDSINKSHSDQAIKLMKESPAIINRIVDAVAKALMRSIAKEIQSSQYVSLILSRHTDAKISSILRFVKEGKVVERFFGFAHVSRSTPLSSVYEHVKSLVNEIDVGSKCMAISLDGAILPHSEVSTLCGKLKNDVPNCVFVPWHSHVIDFVLQQSLSANLKCKRFFKLMAALEACFHDSAELCAALDVFESGNGLAEIVENPGPAYRKFATANFLTYVQENRLKLAMFFDSVLTYSSRWDSDDVVRAIGFRDCLRDETTAFLLGVFARISTLVSPLRTALDSNIPERNFGKGIVSDLVTNLCLMQYQDFKTLDSDDDLGLEEECHISLFSDIIKRVIAEVETRYSKLDNFRFCCLFDFLEEEWFAQSDSHLQDLKKCYNIDFNQQQAHSETELLWNHGAFSKPSVYDFHQYLHESHLKHTFKSMFDFSELVLVMPFKHASLTRETSVLNKIEKWSRVSQLAPTCVDSSILFVESDYLLEMKQLPDFYDEVFDILSD